MGDNIELAAIINSLQGRLIWSMPSTRATGPITIREMCHLSNRLDTVRQGKKRL